MAPGGAVLGSVGREEGKVIALPINCSMEDRNCFVENRNTNKNECCDISVEQSGSA